MKNIFVTLIIIITSALAEAKTLTAQVDGMTCPSCAASVEREVKKIKGVSDVSINIRSGKVEIIFKDDQTPSEENIIQAIKKAGYKLVSISGS